MNRLIADNFSVGGFVGFKRTWHMRTLAHRVLVVLFALVVIITGQSRIEHAQAMTAGVSDRQALHCPHAGANDDGQPPKHDRHSANCLLCQLCSGALEFSALTSPIPALSSFFGEIRREDIPTSPVLTAKPVTEAHRARAPPASV
jgi:hypothetical protein